MSQSSRGQKDKPKKPPAPVLQAPPAPTPSVTTETDKRQDRRISLSLAVAGLSMLISLSSAYFAYRSANESAEANAISRAAQDRAAGKVQARFEFVDEDRDPIHLKKYMRKQDGYDRDVFRIESVDELIRWGPRVTIKNTGTEPIDAIKADINYVIGSAYGVGVKQLYPVPYVMNEISSHEAVNFGKLMPGKAAQVTLSSLLLRQISRMNWKDYGEKDHHGVFTVEVYCRLVGSTSYDKMEEKRPKVFEFHWRPAGFKDDAVHVKELLEMKPSVELQR